MLCDAELLELEEELQAVFAERFERILTTINMTGRLEEWLSIMGLSHLLQTTGRVRDGKIIVVGASMVPKATLLGIVKSMGLNKERFEFHLEYEDAKTYDFSKLQHREDKYSLVMVGPMPHSGTSKNDASSIIEYLKNTEDFPPVIELGAKNQQLHISKSDFRQKLEYAVNAGYITK